MLGTSWRSARSLAAAGNALCLTPAALHAVASSAFLAVNNTTSSTACAATAGCRAAASLDQAVFAGTPMVMAGGSTRPTSAAAMVTPMQCSSSPPGRALGTGQFPAEQGGGQQGQGAAGAAGREGGCGEGGAAEPPAQARLEARPAVGMYYEAEAVVFAGSGEARPARPTEEEQRALATAHAVLLEAAEGTPEMAALRDLLSQGPHPSSSGSGRGDGGSSGSSGSSDASSLWRRFQTLSGLVQPSDAQAVVDAAARGGAAEEAAALEERLAQVQRRAWELYTLIWRVARSMGATPEQVAEAMATTRPGGKDTRGRLAAQIRRLHERDRGGGVGRSGSSAP